MTEQLRLVARLHCMEKTRGQCVCFEKNKLTFCAGPIKQARISVEVMNATSAKVKR